MSTGSIRHNIEITDSADAERFVEALEKAKAESEGVMENQLETIKKRVAHRQAFYHTLDATLRQTTDDIMYLIDKIEAQQQEIENWKRLFSERAEAFEKAVEMQHKLITQIDSLTANKDELAGRLMQFEKLAKDLYFAYTNKDPDCPHDFEIKAIERYQALLGGKEE